MPALEARFKRLLIGGVITSEGGVRVRQGQEEGLVYANSCAKPIVGDKPLAVLLPCVLIDIIWPILAQAPPSAGDQIQLADAFAALIKTEQVDTFYRQAKAMIVLVIWVICRRL